jgi:hypothetical protein
MAARRTHALLALAGALLAAHAFAQPRLGPPPPSGPGIDNLPASPTAVALPELSAEITGPL